MQLSGCFSGCGKRALPPHSLKDLWELSGTPVNVPVEAGDFFSGNRKKAINLLSGNWRINKFLSTPGVWL
jgi:hypothetical protein